MDQVGEVSSIIQDHVEGLTILEVQRLLDAPHVLLVRLALPGVHWRNTAMLLLPAGHTVTHSSHWGGGGGFGTWNAGFGDGGGSMVLGGENVAAGPLNL